MDLHVTITQLEQLSTHWQSLLPTPPLFETNTRYHFIHKAASFSKR